MPLQLDLIDFFKHGDAPGDAAEAAPGPPEVPDSGDAGFETDVSRAVYSAQIMRPIFDLEARRLYQGEAPEAAAIWEQVDLMGLAFAILDVISELTEYQDGATRREVLARVLPLARRQLPEGDTAPAEDGLQAVLNRVFDHLVNRSNRYLPFDCRYFDGVSGRYRRRKFWLVKTVYTGAGQEARFNLTDEGYCAYFGLHETSALDATAIGNLRIKLLIERGSVDDAIAVADGNRKQCARKALEVRNTRRAIRRNIQAVDYDQVHALAAEGVHQATAIQQESGRLHNLVLDNLLDDRDRPYEIKLQRLAERLEGVNHHLMKLAGELQRLPEDYHRHSHKLFRRRSTGAFPPMDAVMRRICGLAETDAARIGAEFIARIDPPARRALFDPAAIIEACDRALERQKVPGDSRQALIEVDAEPVSRFVPELDEALMRQAFATLQAAVQDAGALRLSALLSETAAAAGAGLLPAALAMAVFQCVVERRIAERHRLRVRQREPETLIAVDLAGGRRYRGHELILSGRPAGAP